MPHHGRLTGTFACAILLLVVSFALILGACQAVRTTEPGAMGVERAQQMSPLVSEADLQRGAANAYRGITAEATKKGQLNRDNAELTRIRTIARQIVEQSRVFRVDALDWPWEVNVIASPEVNAWCMPGGKIAIYSGFIDRIKPTDAELAAVIGHEVAHALREHARERASKAITQGLLLEVVGRVAGVGAGTIDLTQLALQVTLNLPSSREQEDEADRVGVELAARAGYDPRAAVTLWQKMTAVGGQGSPEFLSTHPSGEHRQRDVAAYAAKVLPLYEAALRRK
jgi:predicted Zn-dependent protease